MDNTLLIYLLLGALALVSGPLLGDSRRAEVVQAKVVPEDTGNPTRRLI